MHLSRDGLSVSEQVGTPAQALVAVLVRDTAICFTGPSQTHALIVNCWMRGPIDFEWLSEGS